MKNKNLVGLLAMASCVILGGCNPEPAEVKITLGELPVDIVLGEFDLAEYVTLENANSFEVALAEDSQGIASVEGTKINVTGEGTVNFAVTAGGKAAEGSFEAVSQIRKNAKAALGTPVDTYASFTLATVQVPVEGGDPETRTVVNKFTYHCPDYIFSNEYFWGYEAPTYDKGTMVDPGVPYAGVLKFKETGNLHDFTMDSTGKIDVSAAKEPAAVFTRYNNPFSLDLSKFVLETETYEEGGETFTEDYLVMDETDDYEVSDLAHYSFSINLNPIYEYVAVELYETDFGFQAAFVGSAPSYAWEETWDGEEKEGEFETVTDYLAVRYIEVDPEQVALLASEEVEAFIEDPTNEPLTKDYSELRTALGNILDSKNYTLEFSSNWYGRNRQTWERIPFGDTALGGNVKSTYAGTAFETWPELYMMARSELPLYALDTTYKVTDTKTYEKDENLVFYRNGWGQEDLAGECGLLVQDNEVYSYQTLTAQYDGVPTDGLYAEKIGVQGDGLFGNEDFYGNTLEILENDDLWENFFVTEREDLGDGIFYFEAMADQAQDILFSLVDNTYLYSVFGSFFRTDYGQEVLAFSTMDIYVNTITNEVEINQYLIWSNDGVYYLTYEMDFTFKDIGETEIPSLSIDFETLNAAE